MFVMLKMVMFAMFGDEDNRPWARGPNSAADWGLEDLGPEGLERRLGTQSKGNKTAWLQIHWRIVLRYQLLDGPTIPSGNATQTRARTHLEVTDPCLDTLQLGLVLRLDLLGPRRCGMP